MCCGRFNFVCLMEFLYLFSFLRQLLIISLRKVQKKCDNVKSTADNFHEFVVSSCCIRICIIAQHIVSLSIVLRTIFFLQLYVCLNCAYHTIIFYLPQSMFITKSDRQVDRTSYRLRRLTQQKARENAPTKTATKAQITKYRTFSVAFSTSKL